MGKHHLPVFVEQSVGQIEVLKMESASKFDTVVREETHQANLTVSCTSGCASCCYHPISISILEAIPIYRSLLRHGRWNASLRKKLEESGRHQLGVDYEVWLLALIPCPLLTSEKRCGVYEERPLVCRTHVSVGDPYYCHPHHIGPHTQVLPNNGIMRAFHQDQAKVLHKHHLQLNTMPIGTALLLAEKVCTGEMELGAVDSHVFKEYLENA